MQVKTLTIRRVYPILTLLLLHCQFIFAQPGILDPSDPEIVFSSTNKPAAPAWGMMSKWGHTRGLSWDSYALGYRCYYFKGTAFRIKFPKTYQSSVVDGKKYPVFIFYNGLGEKGDIWNNENSLLLGGQEHVKKVNDGTFDGFLIYPQSQTGYYDAQFAPTADLIDSMVKYVKADPDRVILSGLSAGGQGVWLMAADYAPKLAALIPISAAHLEDTVNFNKYITLPVWAGNGGLDNNPYPENATIVFNAFKRLGGNLRQSYWPDQGHAVWNAFWAQPGYYATLSTYHKANPLVYFGRTQFCSGETINVNLGLQAGFYAYEWQKDGTTLSGATTNTLTVTAYGTYRAHFKRTASSAWSDWSPTPVVISLKQPTVAPVIQTKGLHSKVLPAPDGSTTVPLMEPGGYLTYEWRRVSDNALVSDSSVYDMAVAGQQYKVKVTEPYGCSSVFSPLFSVVNAAGSGAPDKAANVAAAVQANNTSVKVSWTDNPTPTYNETGFELYRATTTGGPYQMVGLTAANATSFLDQGLTPKIRYYYLVRAVNNSGAAPISSEVNVITNADSVAPTAPSNLHVTSSYHDYITLYWNAATDNVKVTDYVVYVNGVRAYTTTATNFTVHNMDPLINYTFYVRAEDLSGNLSPQSNQVTAGAKIAGLSYKYYEGSWSVVPDFSRFTAKVMGITPNVDISKKQRSTDYAFLWKGYIYIKVPGTYYFETYSSSGSKLYIPSTDDKTLYSTTPVVNNDGIHAAQYKGGSYSFSKAGWYSIAISYFQTASSGEAMQIYWTCSAAGMTTRTLIPDSVLSEKGTALGAVPVVPSSVKATTLSYDRVSLQWSDNSSNETSFEVVRSTEQGGTYVTVATVSANTTSCTDSTCKPSTTYYYKIRAANNNGMSAFGPIVSATTTASRPTANKLPVLNPINSVFLKPGGSSTTTFSSTDDAGEVLTATITGLPSFATYQQTGNGTGQFTFTPTIADVGVYTISVTITDNYDGSTQTSFTVCVGDKNTRSIYVNIGAQGETPSTKPWNNLLAYPTAGLTLSNLRDESDAITPYSFTVLDQFTGTASNGMITGDNSGIYPDQVIKGAFYENTTIGRRIKFSGLNAAKRYNVVVYGSVNAGVEAQASFSSGTQSASLNGKYNSSQAAQLNRLTPDANGEIIITMTKETASFWAVLSAVVLEEYDSTLQLVGPEHLLVEPTSITKLKLLWADRANNESGYQIYRASSASATYALIATVGANVTTYTDTKVAENTKYYYQVRAVSGSLLSEYSNVASVVNAKRVVYVNFEAGESPARKPWNNTNKELVTGAVVTTLYDNKGLYTGFGLKMLSDFNDEHDQGVSTGNNSGIYPDSVMQSTCWLGPNQTTTYKLTGLDQSKAYRLWFFGSWTSAYVSDYTTTYTVNGRTVYLNSYNNSTKAVYIDGLRPDEKGELLVQVYAPATSVYGFESALVIDYYDPGLLNQSKPGVSTTPLTANAMAKNSGESEKEVLNPQARAYPNPFNQQINVSFTLSERGEVALQVVDMNGRLVVSKELKDSGAGMHTEVLNFAGSALPRGTYLIRVVSKGGVSQTLKVIKN